MAVDTSRTRATPEGVTLTLRVAGPPVRFLAFAVDTLVVLVVQVVLAVPLALLEGAGAGLFLLSSFALTWCYPVAFEVWRDGATPGKSAFGLLVVHDDGTPVAFGASAVRNLVRAADFLPFAFAAGLVSMLVSRDFQRLGDLAAGGARGAARP